MMLAPVADDADDALRRTVGTFTLENKPLPTMPTMPTLFFFF
jgi:hypothetical protein